MMKNSSTKIKWISLVALWVFTLASAGGAYYAFQIPTNYSMDQFLPKKHQLLRWDQESKKVFQISETSPHILLMTFDKGGGSRWFQAANLKHLNDLSEKIGTLRGVQSVVSLGNISSAYESKGELMVGSLVDLQKQGFSTKNILNNPLYTPNLMSKDGLSTSVFVIPEDLSQDDHRALMAKIKTIAKKTVPQAKIQIGGPAAIRTQLIDLLSREIAVFILLALLCAVAILKLMFRGWMVIPQALFVLLVANLLALGVMGLMGISFNILSSTLPIIVTVSALGIFTHMLVRMAEKAQHLWLERMQFLSDLVREVFTVITLTGVSTAIGFACLIPSDVGVISDYGTAVALGVMVACFSTLVLVPSLYVWVRWPIPRDLLSEPKRFSYWIVRHSKSLSYGLGVLLLGLFLAGTKLSWTAKLFDDLPHGHAARKSTDLISKRLGGVATVDFMVGAEKLKEPWKQPQNVARLYELGKELRARKDVGSVLSLADFLHSEKGLPKNKAAVAEMQFLYGMSGDQSPLTHFLSSNEKWTRVAVRLPDLPADKNQATIAAIKSKIEKRFPGMTVKVSGLAAIVPPMNKELSKQLMWGFFEALFWIVLGLAVYFRSLRWAVVGVLPNLFPPVVLLAFLAYFDVAIKPGIAIIFSISLGIAFDNTIYILGRLKHILKSRPQTKSLPIYTLMKKETMPCLVSSLCLFAGFSIFMLSVFPVNRIFGVFVLLSIVAGLLGDLVWLPALLKRFPWILLHTPSRAKIKDIPFNLRETAVRLSPYIMLIALGLIAFKNSYASGSVDDVKAILKSVEQKAAPPNERVQIKMVIQESDGSKKERVLTILRKNDGESRALVRLQQPSDLKGLSLLTVATKGKEDQWLYLPSDKKSRRILGSNKKGKFLDSEIAYEDLRLSTYMEFANKIIKDDGKMIEIESKAKPDSESSYGRILTWITKPDHRIEKVEYFDKSGKLLKRAEFKGYTKVGEKYWRAKQVLVQNVQTRRKTQMLVQKISVDPIDADEVSLSALED